MILFIWLCYRYCYHYVYWTSLIYLLLCIQFIYYYYNQIFYIYIIIIICSNLFIHCILRILIVLYFFRVSLPNIYTHTPLYCTVRISHSYSTIFLMVYVYVQHASCRNELWKNVLAEYIIEKECNLATTSILKDVFAWERMCMQDFINVYV